MKVLIALACVAVASALPPAKLQTPDIIPAFAPQETPAAPEVDAVRIEDAPLSEVDDRTVENALGPQTPDITPVFVSQEVPYKVTVEDSPPTLEVDTVRVVDAPLDEVVDPVNVVDAPVYEPISRSELETLVFMLHDDPVNVVVIDHYPQIPLLPPRGVQSYPLPPYYQNPLWR